MAQSPHHDGAAPVAMATLIEQGGAMETSPNRDNAGLPVRVAVRESIHPCQLWRIEELRDCSVALLKDMIAPHDRGWKRDTKPQLLERAKKLKDSWDKKPYFPE